MKTYFRFFVIFLVFSCWISYTASAQVVLIYTGNTSTLWITPAEATTEAETTKSLLQVAGIQAEITENENRVKQWMLQTTSDGSVDVLILYGVIPTTIYPSGNAMPDGSVAEDWIETSDGNTILNHADYFGFQSTGGLGNNGPGGLQNLMDIPNILAFNNTPMFVTTDGSTLTPSLVDFQSTRALPLNQLEGDWFAEKILASNTGDARATLADPVVVRDGNRGRIAIVHQTVFEDNPNGEVAAEIIVNYLLADASKGVIPDKPGPKIEGPWLWMIAPTGRGGAQAAASRVDFLAQASGDLVTEQQIATEGATPGEMIGNKVWTPGKLAPTGGDNITQVVNATDLGQGDIDNHVAYGSIVLDSPRRQKTTMYVGSNDAVKVWLNGVLVHSNPINRGADDYQDVFPVVLKRGTNILLVAVYQDRGGWSGFFGFKNDTVYSLPLLADAGKDLIPDAGLAAAVRKTLDLAPNAPITKQAMQRLTTLDAADRQITNLTGLEHATQLEALILSGNQIRDIRPLAGLTALMVLGLQDNQIEDLDPLTKLTQLQVLSLNNNQIRYVGPLARLTRLKELRLAQNKIRDVSKFTGLVNLETLSLAENPITDMSPLASLTKLVEVDIEIIPPASKGVIPDAGLAAAVRKTLDLAPNAPITKQAMQRLTTLDAADRQITNLTGLEHATQLEALILSGNQIRDIRPLAGLTALMVLGLQDNQIEDLDPLTKLTQLQVLSLNNNQIRYVGPLARLTRLKELRLAQNKIRDVSKFTGLVNLETLSLAENPITDMSPLASLKKLVEVDIETEVVPIIDAVLSISPSPVASPAIGELLTLSLNIGTDEMVAGYQVTLQFDATALRYVESSNGDYLPDGAFFVPPVVNRGRLELASSALAGVSEGDGTLATITFEVLAVKASTLTLSETLLSDDQGNTFRPRVEQGEVTEPPKLKGDVNGDGVVNVQDLVLVGLSFGKTGQDAADINGDGVVNIGDLVLVAGALGDVAAAPAVYAASMEPFTAQEVRQWLIEARLSGENSLAYRRGIFMLEQLLMALMPKETALLPNYPNPFNPETWIPYELATDTHVRITIYNTQGVVIRTLQFGHQSAGYYTGRDRAAYWDGRNALGEQVASGLYFYQLETDEMSSLRKMVILK